MPSPVPAYRRTGPHPLFRQWRLSLLPHSLPLVLTRPSCRTWAPTDFNLCFALREWMNVTQLYSRTDCELSLALDKEVESVTGITDLSE